MLMAAGKRTPMAPTILEIRNMSKLPEFINDLPESEVQPISVRREVSEFVAIIQWDGTGEFQHWVLVPNDQIDNIIKQLEALK